MGLLKRKDKGKDKDEDDEGGEEKEKPTDRVPLSRPPTSGSDFGLLESSQQARSAYQRAQRAAKTHRVRKEATAAKTNKEIMVESFKNSFKEFVRGLKAGWKYMKLWPAVWKEKEVNAAMKREEKRRKRLSDEMKAVEKRKKEMDAAGEGGAGE